MCLNMCDLLSLPACPVSFFRLSAVSPKYFSEYVFSGHLTKYVRSDLCTSFVWSFVLHEECSFLLLGMCCAAWLSGNSLLM